MTTTRKQKTIKFKEPRRSEFVMDDEGKYVLSMLNIRGVAWTRYDIQHVRLALGGRIGVKADGTPQNVTRLPFREHEPETWEKMKELFDEIPKYEKDLEKELLRLCRTFKAYPFLEAVLGAGPVVSGVLLGSINPFRAANVSKITQFAGLNPSAVRGKKRCAIADYKGSRDLVTTVTYDKDGKPEDYIYITDILIPGDKLTKGFVAPFNTKLRMMLCGIMADSFVRIGTRNKYVAEVYYPVKERLRNSDNMVAEIRRKGQPPTMVKWRDARPGHIDRAARRAMVKEFVKDFYVAIREALNLPVRAPYAEEYLGRKHSGGGMIELGRRKVAYAELPSLQSLQDDDMDIGGLL